MNYGRNIEKVLLSLGIFLIFSSRLTKSISEFRFITDYLFYFGGLLILIFAINSLIKKDMIMNSAFKLLTSIYGGFVLLVIVSTFVNQNLETEIGALEKFFLIYLFLVICIALTDLVSEELIIKSFITSTVIIITYFLIEYPISETPLEAYKGGFSNQNSIGVLAVTLFSVSLVACTSLIKKKRHYLLAVFYLLIALGAGYLVIISSSRTSFLTLVIVFAIVSITFTYDVLKTRNLLSWKSVLFVIIIAIGATVLFVLINNPIYEALESRIIDKFSRKLESGSLTGGRTSIWTTIIDNAGLFGKGSGYFSKISGHGAHNSFLHILSLYGWFAAIAYVVFWLAMLIKSAHYYVTNKTINTYALLPLIVIVNYILVSMMENMTFHISVYLGITMVAIFSKSKEKPFGFNV